MPCDGSLVVGGHVTKGSTDEDMYSLDFATGLPCKIFLLKAIEILLGLGL